MRYGWLLTLGIAGCDDTLFGVAATDGETITATGYDGVQAILADNCYACHGSAPAGNTLDLQTDLVVSTVDVPSTYGPPLVTAGDPDNSVLYLKVVGDASVGGVMPPGAGLSDPEIEVIRQWIEDGASNL